MNLKNIFKRKQTEEQIKKSMLKGNKSNLTTSLFMSAVVVSVITFTLKPDSMTNDNALMIEAINKRIELKEKEKEAEKDNANRRDHYIESLRQKGMSRHQIRMHINNLSDEQRKNKGFPVQEKKTDYSQEILKLKQKQEREKEVESNLNVRVNKKRKLSYS